MALTDTIQIRQLAEALAEQVDIIRRGRSQIAHAEAGIEGSRDAIRSATAEHARLKADLEEMLSRDP